MRPTRMRRKRGLRVSALITLDAKPCQAIFLLFSFCEQEYFGDDKKCVDDPEEFCYAAPPVIQQQESKRLRARARFTRIVMSGGFPIRPLVNDRWRFTDFECH